MFRWSKVLNQLNLNLVSVLYLRWIKKQRGGGRRRGKEKEGFGDENGGGEGRVFMGKRRKRRYVQQIIQEEGAWNLEECRRKERE